MVLFLEISLFIQLIWELGEPIKLKEDESLKGLILQELR